MDTSFDVPLVGQAQPHVTHRTRRDGARGRLRLLALMLAPVVLGIGGVGEGVRRSERRAAVDQLRIGALAASLRLAQQDAARVKTRLDWVAESAAVANGVDADTVRGTRLKNLSSLPGYGRSVPVDMREKLRSATVKVVSRLRNTTDPWWPWCTGTLVENEGAVMIASAAHCFDEVGAIRSRLADVRRPPTAADISTRLPFEWAIADGDAPEVPIAFVDKVVVAVADPTYDGALLGLKDGTQTAAFAKHQRLPMTFTTPTPGEGVFIHGFSAAKGTEAVETSGIFAGTAKSFGQSGGPLQVAVPDATDRDRCGPGMSGGAAIFASGFVASPLHSGLVNPSIGSDPRTTAEHERGFFLSAEQETGVDLIGVPSVCQFGVPDRTSFSAQAQVLRP